MINRKSRQQLTLQDFEILNTLGTGTFGRVRLVKVKNQKQLPPFALKMLKKTVVIKLKQVEHIKSEKSILERVRHPFIIHLQDLYRVATFQDDVYIYMLLEYISGGELFSRLRREGRFANDVALFYACEIVLCFEYLHGLKVAYRDLKPENVLIDKQGHIKLTDFGFAKVLNSRTYTLCGTPEYLAPEIIQNQGHDLAVDWWALGVLIYEMIAGFPPFYDENPVCIYQKILSGRIEFSRVFSRRVKDLVKKLLQANPQKRYGCLHGGPEDVKRHKWFRGVDWTRVYRREIPAPWTPKLIGEDDTHFFDNYPESVEPSHAPASELDVLFRDFQASKYFCKMVSFLSQEKARRIDQVLMEVMGYSIDQLMELAGLSVAQSFANEFQANRILIVCGPGNNGGDGLVAARHLKQFQRAPEVFYPKPTQNPLFLRLIEQCRQLEIPVHSEEPDYSQFEYIIDAIFGFSFSGEIRPPFDKVIRDIKDSGKPVVSVDIPSGWDVEAGNSNGQGLEPVMLVSLTAPKLCAQNFTGVHYIGGRFVPPSLLRELEFTVPPYPNFSQFVKLQIQVNQAIQYYHRLRHRL